jgi:hypothetical protein
MAEPITMMLDDAIQLANDMLRGQKASPTEALAIVKVLHEGRKFGIARRLLDRYAEDPRVKGDPDIRHRVAQKRALSTYKDPDLPTDLQRQARDLPDQRGHERPLAVHRDI